jgi:hypothetical protein
MARETMIRVTSPMHLNAFEGLPFAAKRDPCLRQRPAQLLGYGKPRKEMARGAAAGENDMRTHTGRHAI